MSLLFVQLVLALRAEALVIEISINAGTTLIVLGTILVELAHDDCRDSTEYGVCCQKYSERRKRGVVGQQSIEELHVEEKIEVDECVVYFEIKPTVLAVLPKLEIKASRN